MLSRWPIRRKLYIGIGVLLVTVSVLAFSGFQGVYAYRGLARSVSRRSAELPLATTLARAVSELRIILSSVTGSGQFAEQVGQVAVDRLGLKQQFQQRYSEIRLTLEQYRDQLYKNELTDARIGDKRSEWDREWETVHEIERALSHIENANRSEDWILDDGKLAELGKELAELDRLAAELPSFLQRRMEDFAGEVRLQYRTLIVLTWITSLLATLLLGLLGRIFYTWVLHPLRLLIQGSRRVAAGDFSHRIHLESRDEMAELAGAMNQMTIRFQEIRDDLDRQVRQRTKQALRNEQLASVGFLAAGVAHEINNPLASIALCAESLEDRVHDIIVEDDAQPDGERNEEITVLRHYLRMIQDEAFRCKEITEQLLDFSRLGNVKRQRTDLAELVRSVVEMVGHVGKYKGKSIHFRAETAVMATVNPQELKQVVLNLVTNGLDSIDEQGRVTVHLSRSLDEAELVVSDNGCGMADEVLEHVFEPFYTCRRDGQGTGLGLAISCRIIADHGGQIDAHSDGVGRGAVFRVSLPLAAENEEHEKSDKAA